MGAQCSSLPIHPIVPIYTFLLLRIEVCIPIHARNTDLKRKSTSF